MCLVNQSKTLVDKTNPKKTLVKRCLDIVISLSGLLITSPLLLIIALAIKLSGGNVLFKHRRVGQHGKPINVYKFRTMHRNAEEQKKQFTPEQWREFNQNYKLKNDPRVTLLGQFLRKSSLDELPQLINVLMGNMSIVGPRPVTFPELEKYGENVDLLLSTKPGLTGLWQVNGRSNASYEERISLDILYVQKCTVWTDIIILLKTPLKILKREGAC